jgi:leader peptidase (prepilin peptidase)/N-methyltransferase
MMAGAPVVLYVTLLGLVFGSFFNVVIYRLPRGQSLWWPSSRCPRCGKPVRAIDNIPVVSWLLLRGRCRDCGNPISIQYPIVEAVTAAVFFVIAWVTPAEPVLVSRLVLASALIVLFAIDLELQILPNAITLPGIVIGFAFSFVTPTGWLNSLIGIALGGGLLYAIAGAYYLWRRQEGMGMGDVKMLAMIGAFLGWQAVILTLILSSFAGAIVGVGMMAADRGDMKVALPFGTFLALGALAAMLFGDALIGWYAGFYQL